MKILDGERLPDTMNAVVLTEPFNLKYTTIPVWPINTYNDPDMILVKIKACGVCGSDFRYFQGENPWSQHTVGKHIDSPPNIVLGHEYSGIVVAVLSEENEKWLGKRVVPICSQVCGKCVMCQTNRTHLCEQTIHMGHGQGWGKRPYYPGAYAEYAPAWAAGCYEIPAKLTFEEAAMMDVLAVCMHAFKRANHHKGFPILIMGGGPIGNGIGQIARNSGVEDDRLIILDNSSVAIDVAEKNRFRTIVDSSNKNGDELHRRILELTGKKKILSIFDSIGTEMSFDLGFRLLGKGGTFVNMAVHDQKIVNFNQMQLSSERTITTSSNFSIPAYERAWEWLCDGKLAIEPWLTKISLKEVPQIFTDTIKNKKGREYFKLVIQQK